MLMLRLPCDELSVTPLCGGGQHILKNKHPHLLSHLFSESAVN